MNTLYRDISLTLDEETYKKIAFFECVVNNDLIKSKTFDIKGIYFQKGNIKFGHFVLKSLGYTLSDYSVIKGNKYYFFKLNKNDLAFDRNDLVFVRMEQAITFK